jgi:hypothetical protein
VQVCDRSGVIVPLRRQLAEAVQRPCLELLVAEVATDSQRFLCRCNAQRVRPETSAQQDLDGADVVTARQRVVERATHDARVAHRSAEELEAFLEPRVRVDLPSQHMIACPLSMVEGSK